jgi:hypothetical protein
MYKATLTALLLCLLVPAPALAQSKTPIELFNEGSDLAEQGKLKEAVSLWVMIAEDIPDKYRATVQVNLGLAYKQLERPVEAWHHLSRYLATNDDQEVATWRAELETELRKTHVRVNIRCVPADATLVLQSAAGSAVTYRCPLTWWFMPGSHPVRADADDHKRKVTMVEVKAGSAQELQIALESNQQYGTLVVQGDGRAVQVFLDGRLEGSVPFKRKIRTGKYELMVGAPGKMPWRKEIVVVAGKTLTEAPEVARKPVVEPVEADPVHTMVVTSPPEPPRSQKTLAWTLIGTGAAGLIGGAALHGVAFANNEDLRSKYPDGTAESPQPVSHREAYEAGYQDDVKPLIVGAGVLYGVGAVSAIAGTVVLLLKDNPADRKTQLQPIAAPGTVGMTFDWTF